MKKICVLITQLFIKHMCPDHPNYMCDRCLENLEIKKEGSGI